MLNIATPRLSPAEWQDVRATLTAMADCGCTPPPPAGSLRARLARAADALIGGKAAVRSELPARLHVVRDFLCESGRSRRIADHYLDALTAQGFSRAQIDALALLGA